MIIDASHGRWIVGTSIGAVLSLSAYVWFDRSIVGGVTGGTTIGLWFGVIAAILMLFCGSFVLLRLVPSWWWLGSRKAWLKAHIWLGLLSVVLVLCHSGFRVGEPVTLSLWLVLAAIVLSGVFGLVMQQSLPGLLSRRVTDEVAYEQIEHYCGILRGRADDLCDSLHHLWNSPKHDSPQARFLEMYEQQIRPFFATKPKVLLFPDEPAVRGWFDRLRETLRLAPADDAAAEADQLVDSIRARMAPEQAKELLPRLDKLRPAVSRLMAVAETTGLPQATKTTLVELQALAEPARDAAAGIERLCAATWIHGIEELCVHRGRLRTQERIHYWLHGWLLIHVPLSAILLILTIAHVVMSLYY